MALLRHEQKVLDPYAGTPRKVDPGFDRHDHASPERYVSAARKTGAFMHVQTKPMSKAVAKVFSVSVRLQISARDRVHFAGLPTCPDPRHGSTLGG